MRDPAHGDGNGRAGLRCDALVVGAGPAGSATAYWLARSGIDVLLVDRMPFPRHKPCGDGLTARAVTVLQDMGLGDALAKQGRPFNGLRILSDGRDPFLIDLHPRQTPARHGLIFPRLELDDLLRQQAMQAGARFLAGFDILDSRQRKGRISAVEGRRGEQRLAIAADLIIVATGARRTVLHALGISNGNAPGGLALRAYASGIEGLDDHLEVYLDDALLPGYAWVFPTGDATANIGAGIRLDGISPHEGSLRLRAAFARLQHSARFTNAHIVGRVQGLPLRTDFPALATSAPSVLIAGEAAGLVNPLTGEGIAFALESGRLAAEVTAAALNAGDVSAGYLRRYDDLLHERYGDYFADAHELLTRVSHPAVLGAVVQRAFSDDAARRELRAAIIDEQPRRFIRCLETVLSGSRETLAGALFMLNAYRPTLNRCRSYMLEHVRQDTPSLALLPLLGRGKMLRALLVFAGCEAAGGEPDQVIPAAAGIELVHTASLIHDDIMDNARTRRGLSSLHTLLGVSQAIVCGDYLIAKSFRLLAESRVKNPAANVVDAFIIGAESGVRTCTGQFSDVGLASDDALSEKMYDRIVAKTAAAIAGALMAGCALAGGDDHLQQALSQYGQLVGRAFQIRDDTLDFVNATADLALVERRPSFPLIHAFQHGDSQSRKLIRSFLAGETISGDALTSVLRASDSLAYAEQAAADLGNAAVDVAQTIPHVQGVLEAFARYAVVRDQ